MLLLADAQSIVELTKVKKDVGDAAPGGGGIAFATASLCHLDGTHEQLQRLDGSAGGQQAIGRAIDDATLPAVIDTAFARGQLVRAL